jgi:5-methylcytosine-specific restriction endonuclease McrA
VARPKLQSLKPRLQTLNTSRVQSVKAVQRKTGSAGVRDRHRIRERDCDLCKNCQHHGREVDHTIPLWADGSDDESNKGVLCDYCHSAKTDLETKQRAAGAYDREAVLQLMAKLKQERSFSFMR